MYLVKARYSIKLKTISTSMCILLLLSCSSGGSDDVVKPPPSVDTTPPSAPTNLAAVNTTVATTDLNWTAATDNVGIKDYSVYKDDVFIVTTQTTTYNVTGLSANTSYTFKVKANDNAGNMSGFSNSTNVTTQDDTPTIVVASGDIEIHIGNSIDNAPGNSGNDYVVPTTDQLNTWNIVIDDILADNIQNAVSKASGLNYQVVEFTDTSISPNQVFYILEEKPQQTNYWGTYVFSKTPEKDDLIIQSTHSKYDTNTGKEAVFCFKNNVARALFINGTHRCNNDDSSSCSGTTSACGSSDPFRISDMAHNTNSVFQKTTENLFNTISSSVFVQLHGFGKQASDPYVIMSNGTRKTPSTDYATLIKDALLIEDNTLTFKLAHIDTDWTRLIGFTNTQGRLINSSANHCSTSATTTSGRFIHVEQEKTKLRDDASGWAKMSNALGSVFN